MSIDFKNFKWDFESEVQVSEKGLKIKALPNSDYFVDPAGSEPILNAPYYHIETDKDFVLKAKVSRSFRSVFDACVLMLMSDEKCWVKLCFELTDLGNNAVVSVVTNDVSDDANGANIQGDTVYLQMAKKGNLFALHYSLDGKDFKMVRYFALSIKDTFKLGFVAQSPTGDGGDCFFEDIELRYDSLKDLRKGI